MKSVLILGGNGFIGKNLAEQLVCQGEAVTCFDLNPPQKSIDKVRYIQGSFWDENKLEEITDHIDVVFHAVSSINPGTSNQKYMQGYSMDFIHTVKLCEIIKKKEHKNDFSLFRWHYIWKPGYSTNKGRCSGISNKSLW